MLMQTNQPPHHWTQQHISCRQPDYGWQSERRQDPGTRCLCNNGWPCYAATYQPLTQGEPCPLQADAPAHKRPQPSVEAPLPHVHQPQHSSLPTHASLALSHRMLHISQQARHMAGAAHAPGCKQDAAAAQVPRCHIRKRHTALKRKEKAAGCSRQVYMNI
jgi:hypothetical protein